MKPALLLLAALPALAFAQPRDRVADLRDAALNDEVAYDIVEGLTTEIGPRLGGTAQEARAREWAVRKLRSLGFKNVRVETFRMPVWVRGTETASIVAPFPQPLAVTALGGSAATPAEGITAQVIAFDTLATLEAAPAGSLRGKIAFISHGMTATQDGSSYGAFGGARFTGPSIAQAKGAVAVVIRSAGTDYHRNPHTGGTNFAVPGVGAAANARNAIGPQPNAIPAGALSIPDAEQLQRILARGKPVTLKLVLTPRWLGEQESGNVVAEVPGRDPRAGTILIGGHLDSWDLATGAFDNAAGVAITAAAAKRIMDAGRPRRTIRVVWFGAEEVGVFGGRTYHERHKSDGDVVMVAESDFGADRVWRFEQSLGDANKPVADALAGALAPLGVARAATPATAGADLGPWARDGVAAVDLQQDGTRYFDLHHTPDDTLDKVDRGQLRQNVAAWTAMLAVMSETADFRRIE